MLIRAFWLGLLLYFVVALFIYLRCAKRAIITEYSKVMFFILAPVVIFKEASPVTFCITSIILYIANDICNGNIIVQTLFVYSLICMFGCLFFICENIMKTVYAAPIGISLAFLYVALPSGIMEITIITICLLALVISVVPLIGSFHYFDREEILQAVSPIFPILFIVATIVLR